MSKLSEAKSVYEQYGLRGLMRESGNLLNKQLAGLRHGRAGNPDGVSVFERDWDNLVLLDACRYDYFEKHVKDAGLSGTLQSHQSLGSCSREFVQRNFDGRQLHDVVVVSANLWYEQVQQDFDTDIDVHHLELVTERERRDTWRPAPFPDHVTNRVRTVVDEFPDKRLLIHYHQPHEPYIGPTAQRHADPDYPLNIPRQYLHDAYEETLRTVLDELSTVIELLDGKTVVSADHGDLLGEVTAPIPTRMYGHPCEYYHEKLVTVPWFVVDHDSRKSVVAEEPARTRQYMDDDEREARLRDLGYVV
jgi:hypothetical protein